MLCPPDADEVVEDTCETDAIVAAVRVGDGGVSNGCETDDADDRYDDEEGDDVADEETSLVPVIPDPYEVTYAMASRARPRTAPPPAPTTPTTADITP